MSEEKGGKAPIRAAPSTSTLEWIVAAVSALLVLGVIGFLLYDGVVSPKTPPDVRVEVDSIQQAGPGFLVILRARNDGHNTAADVIIEGELMADSGRVETSETTIDYVPAGGEQRAGLYFTRDPRRLKLRLRAHGYRDP
ncbi:MAG TPA: hypothetical protein VHH32_01510 [Gemmatimonadales bacterium]|nr:hypothetical protein [Gemmatimonadales bacterium]